MGRYRRFVVVLAIILTIITFGCSKDGKGAGATNQGEIELNNGYILVRISSIGEITEITDLTTEKSILASSGRIGWSARGFLGHFDDQRFEEFSQRRQSNPKITVEGNLATIAYSGLKSDSGKTYKVDFNINIRLNDKDIEMDYKVSSEDGGITISEVRFPTVRGFVIGDTLNDDTLIWPQKYQGVKLEQLGTVDFVEASGYAGWQMKRLGGLYNGQISMPWFTHFDHELLTYVAFLDERFEVAQFVGDREGMPGNYNMRYDIVTYPRVFQGSSYESGKFVIGLYPGETWYAAAHKYQDWFQDVWGMDTTTPEFLLREQGSFVYGHEWEYLPDFSYDIARYFGMRGVLGWAWEHGGGDHYYPCYFPNPDVQSVEDFTAVLKSIEDRGGWSYLYTNGYLISPLQDPDDVARFKEMYPEEYKSTWYNRGFYDDVGYIATMERMVKEYDLGWPEWLYTKGAYHDYTIKRIDQTWGREPIFFWHGKPFAGANVSFKEWQDAFFAMANTLLNQFGASGIFIDQIAAMNPEICEVPSEDYVSFGHWNRGYFDIVKRLKTELSKDRIDYFIVTEGLGDVYSKYIDWFWGFSEPNEYYFPEMFRYTMPQIAMTTASFLNPTQELEELKSYLYYAALFGVKLWYGLSPGSGLLDQLDPNLEQMVLMRRVSLLRKSGWEFYDKGTFIDDYLLSVPEGVRAKVYEKNDEVTGLMIAIWNEGNVSGKIRLETGFDNTDVKVFGQGVSSKLLPVEYTQSSHGIEFDIPDEEFALVYVIKDGDYFVANGTNDIVALDHNETVRSEITVLGTVSTDEVHVKVFESDGLDVQILDGERLEVSITVPAGTDRPDYFPVIQLEYNGIIQEIEYWVRVPF